MRLVNRLATLLLGVVLLGGGLLLVVEVFAVALHRESVVVDRAAWYRTLTGTRLEDPWVRTGIVAAGVLGLMILWGQLVRWKPARLPTRLADGWHLQRRSVERQLATVANAVPGVESASARVRREGLGWRTRIRAVGDTSVKLAVEYTVRREVERLGASAHDHVGVQMVPSGSSPRVEVPRVEG